MNWKIIIKPPLQIQHNALFYKHYLTSNYLFITSIIQLETPHYIQKFQQCLL